MSKEQTQDPSIMLPQALVLLPENVNAILVEKSSQKLYLYSSDGNGGLKKMAFPCSTGEEPGMKIQFGDKKTPEGVYFLVDEHEDRDLSPVYGIKAFPTDYPNFMDRQEGRNGSAIWIHGTNKILKPMDSNGCVAMKNEDILTLSNYITLNETPVILAEKLIDAEPGSMGRDRDALLDLFSGWIQAMETGNYHDYLKIYDDGYLPDIQWWTSWLKVRDKAWKLGKSFSILTESLGIYREKDLFVLPFDMGLVLSGESLDLGRRKLFVMKKGDHYTIAGDHFVNTFKDKDYPLVVQAEKLFNSVDAGPSIRSIVDSWLNAWSSKDIKAYGNFYSDDFYSEKMNKEQWLAKKTRLAAKYSFIQVTGSQFKIDKGKTKTVVTFVQDYRSNSLSVKGMKTLVLLNKGGGWKIYQESWKAI